MILLRGVADALAETVGVTVPAVLGTVVAVQPLKGAALHGAQAAAGAVAEAVQEIGRASCRERVSSRV